MAAPIPDQDLPVVAERFRLRARDSGLVIFSQLLNDTVGHRVSTDANDEIFTLFRGAGARDGQYLIKSWPNGRVLFSRTDVDVRVGNVNGDANFNENDCVWFEFDRDNNDRQSFRIRNQASNSVLYSNTNKHPAFSNFVGPNNNDELWRFVLLP